MKTHCVHGHEMTPENTMIERGRWRSCRTCRREQSSRSKQARARGKCQPNPHAPIDITGQRFGRLTALRLVGSGPRRWAVRCDCGTEYVLEQNSLRSGSCKSCGCARRDSCTTHGLAKSPTWNTWNGMMSRCYRPETHSFARYGGRGIQVCARWHKFDGFVADMGTRPHGRTLDRIDNDGNYEPANCRWATLEEQNLNRSTTVKINLGGEILCLTAAAAKLGIHITTLRCRLDEHGDPLRRHSTERTAA